MNRDKKAFLRAIEAAPKDSLPRMIYADWLDERGEVEEANRMRAWWDSYQWVNGMLATHDYEDAVRFTFEEFMAAADEAYRQWKSGEYEWMRSPSIHVGDNMPLQEFLNNHGVEFWAKHYYVLSGNRVPRGGGTRVLFFVRVLNQTLVATLMRIRTGATGVELDILNHPRNTETALLGFPEPRLWHRADARITEDFTYVQHICQCQERALGKLPDFANAFTRPDYRVGTVNMAQYRVRREENLGSFPESPGQYTTCTIVFRTYIGRCGGCGRVHYTRPELAGGPTFRRHRTYRSQQNDDR